MEHFMKYLVLYGFGFGLISFTIFTLIFIGDIKNNRANKMRVFLLPFMGGTSIFASTGIAIIIKNMYKAMENTKIPIIGVVLTIPFVIILLLYIGSHLKEIKEKKEGIIDGDEVLNKGN